MEGSKKSSEQNTSEAGRGVRLGQERQILGLLEQRGVLSREESETVLDELREPPADFERLLLEKYRVSKADLGLALGKFFGCPFIPYDDRVTIDPQLLKNMSVDYLRRNGWIPMKREGSVVEVLSADPRDLSNEVDTRRAFAGCAIRVSVGLRCDIEQFLLNATGRLTRGTIADLLGELVNQIGSDQEHERPELTEHDSAIVRLANHLITEADRLGASDIHIEPYSAGRDTAVRFRVDGTCFTYLRIPAGYRRAIVSRIKIELRVATLPTAGGNEDVTLRLLTAKEPIPLDAMEFDPRVLEQVQQLAERPQGIFLCVGPTGSGKTTTLHAVLRHINTEERKIVTAEDPIELTQEGLRQVQIHPKIGFTFAAAMRAFLRADPDVIMIGEMRDKETADIAIEASLTGHLVLSTLHTNSAVETITRLLDLGCDAFNFSDAMLGVLAQRLCKRLCPSCKEPYHPDRREYDGLADACGAVEWERLGVTYSSEFNLYRGRGCERCNHTGFKGRMALHELLLGSEEITQRIQSRARAAELLTVAKREGMTTLLQHGIQKVLLGRTTFQQVRAVAVR